MMACFKMGLIWRGLKHDASKFLPDEWFPYARHFYEPNGKKKTVRDKSGYYKPTDTGDKDFDFAWLLHQKRNRHHWQWWILPEDDGGTKILIMHPYDLAEMICDWVGAGRAQGVKDWWNPLPWYEINIDKIQLHPTTRSHLEILLDDMNKGNAKLSKR